MIETYLNGHKIIWNNIDKKWYYPDGSSTEKMKPCPKCGKLPDKNGNDACLGELPGVKYACCGHGVHDGYIQFKNGITIRFELKEIKK